MQHMQLCMCTYYMFVWVYIISFQTKKRHHFPHYKITMIMILNPFLGIPENHQQIILLGLGLRLVHVFPPCVEG